MYIDRIQQPVHGIKLEKLAFIGLNRRRIRLREELEPSDKRDLYGKAQQAKFVTLLFSGV